MLYIIRQINLIDPLMKCKLSTKPFCSGLLNLNLICIMSESDQYANKSLLARQHHTSSACQNENTRAKHSIRITNMQCFISNHNSETLIFWLSVYNYTQLHQLPSSDSPQTRARAHTDAWVCDTHKGSLLFCMEYNLIINDNNYCHPLMIILKLECVFNIQNVCIITYFGKKQDLAIKTSSVSLRIQLYGLKWNAKFFTIITCAFGCVWNALWYNADPLQLYLFVQNSMGMVVVVLQVMI